MVIIIGNDRIGGVGGLGGNGGIGTGNSGADGGVGGIGGVPGVIDDNSIDSDAFGDWDDFDGGNRSGSPARPGDRSDAEFPKRDRGFGTIITNSGDNYFGIAPGATARAHVQNIDLRPYSGDGSLSPSEALRRDERRSLRSRFRG